MTVPVGDSLSAVVVEQHGYVRLIRLNRPEKANAISAAMNAALGEAFTTAAVDEGTRVIVITGAGERHFCAGADLKDVAAAADHPTGPTSPAAAAGPGLTAFTETAYPKPVIAAVNGVAVGGGFGIVLACDIILASETATFGIPEVRRGLVGVGVTSRATVRLPIPAVLTMALTGNPIDAQTAKAMFLVSEVLPAADLVPRALALAAQIAEYSPAAIAATKDVVLAVAATRAPDIATLRARSAGLNQGAAARAGANAFVKTVPVSDQAPSDRDVH